MRFENNPSSPRLPRRLVPGSYLRELDELYLSSTPIAPVAAGDSTVGTAGFDTRWPTERGVDRPQTVEQIIRHGYFSALPDDPVMALLSDRKQTSWLGLDDLVGQVRQRLEIYRTNIDDIEQSKLSATNDFHGRKNVAGAEYWRELATLNETLIQLYQQQREERTSLWRDVSRLRQALPEAAQQYLSAGRKLSLLDDPGGDLP